MDRVQRIPVQVRRPASSPPEADPAIPIAAAAPATPAEETASREAGAPGGADLDWRDLALRQQAEMENYRKRQRRLAQDQIEAERERLLALYLPLLDDLERALAAPTDDLRGLRQGVEMTHRAALQRLRAEGVEPIVAQDQPFDPNWHEAVSTVPRDGKGLASGTVIQVLAPGYRLGERLLRPARVVVAL